jgi:hypothetical protein
MAQAIRQKFDNLNAMDCQQSQLLPNGKALQFRLE